MKKEIPLYEAIITDDFDNGLFGIALTKSPAIETEFLTFSKQKQPLKFAISDVENRRIISPIMRADYPIYRYDEKVGDYYIMYSKPTLEKMAKKMLCQNTFNNWNAEHNCNEKLSGIYLNQLFIKNTEKGLNPVGFEDIEEGSLFGVFSIENDAVWNDVKEGRFVGISLEGVFEIEYSDIDIEEDDEEDLTDDEFDEILSLIEEIGNKMSKNNI